MSNGAQYTEGGQLARGHGFDALLTPRSIAVIGASVHETKIGGRPIYHLKRFGFDGSIYPVNPNYEQVQGLECYSSIFSTPEVPDLVIIAVPAHAVLEAVRMSAERGVKAAVLFTAGFTESGAEGASQQLELTRIAESSGMRILGPNCIGAANMRDGVIASFAAAVAVARDSGSPSERRVALVSQSGAIGGHGVATAASRAFYFDPWITTGNEADIDTADSIAYLAGQADVGAIAVYLEGSHDGKRLHEALAAAQRNRKPVIMLKAGRSDVGAAAAASHTASLVGSDDAYDALFAQYGVCRVDSLQELIDTCYALALMGIPDGNKVSIFTGSGGAGILMADAAAESGLEVPQLPATVQADLKALWPQAGVANPIDTTAQVTNDSSLLPAFLDRVIEGTDNDVVLIFLTYLGLMEPWSTRIVESLREVRTKHPRARVMVSALSTEKFRNALHEMDIPCFEDMQVLVDVTGRLAQLNASLRRGPSSPPRLEPRPSVVERGRLYTEDSAKALLAEAGVPTLPERVVQSVDAAKQAADEYGYPVVLKIVSPDILHKSDIGGVALGLSNATEVEHAYQAICTNAAAAHPDAEISGVLVTPMLEGGLETIIGAKKDPTLGMTVAFGLGGVYVEILEDVALRLAPFDTDTAATMIREIRAADLLDGARGSLPVDTLALTEALSRFSVFVAENEENLESIDVNPFVVLPEGQGAVALDALISTVAAESVTAG